MTRYECNDGGANKFWAVTVSGKTLTTCWGRIGTDGQSKAKGFVQPADAAAEMAKLIREKTSKGYRLARAAAKKAKAATTRAASKPAAKATANARPSKPVAKASARGLSRKSSKPGKPSKQEPTTTKTTSALPFPTLSTP